MKRYISIILIPCVLYQLFAGCYSYRDITIDELKNYSGTDNVILNRDGKETILINGEFRDKNTLDWKTSDSTIIINAPKLFQDNGSEILVDMKYEIKYDNIKTIEVEELDGTRTFLLVIGMIGVILAISALIESEHLFSGSGDVF